MKKLRRVMLSALIKQHGMTTRSLAKKLGFHRTTVANWIAGKNQPYICNLQKICDEFGLGLEDLLEDANVQ